MANDELTESMQAVHKAHAVLADFHREVVAFFEILDEQLGARGGPVQLSPENGQQVLMYSQDRLTAAADWAPRWLGRFYHDADAYRDEAAGATYEKLAMAFVWIVAAAEPSDLPGASVPEAIVGIAHPGMDGKTKRLWDAARYGVWDHLPTAKLSQNEWREGKFQDLSGQFGKGSQWRAIRVPLTELPTREAIEEKVSSPLRKAFQEAFAPIPRNPPGSAHEEV